MFSYVPISFQAVFSKAESGSDRHKGQVHLPKGRLRHALRFPYALDDNVSLMA